MAFYARELDYLTSAQKVISSMPITRTNLPSIVGAAGEMLTRFAQAWALQQRIYRRQCRSTDALRIFFGDMTMGLAVGIIPFFIILGAAVALFKIVTKHKWPIKGSVLPSAAELVIKVILMAVGVIVILPIFWTFGILAKYQRYRLDTALVYDTGGASGGAGGGGGEFSKIWRACASRALVQYQNCSLALEPNAGLEPTRDIRGSKCVNGAPSKVSKDADVLLAGLEILKVTDLRKFDVLGLSQRIQRGVYALKACMAPTDLGMGASVSSSRVMDIVLKDIVAGILQSDKYRASTLQDAGLKHALFVSDAESTYSYPASTGGVVKRIELAITTIAADILGKDRPPTAGLQENKGLVQRIEDILLKHWPSVNPAMYIDAIDAAMSSFYNTQLGLYYENYLRDATLMLLASAMDSATAKMRPDGEFVSAQQFTLINWPRVQANVSLVRALVSDMKVAVEDFDKFVPRKEEGTTTTCELATTYIKCALGIVPLLLVLFLVYMLRSRLPQPAPDAPGAEDNTGGFSLKSVEVMDMGTIILAGVAGTMLVMTMLVVIKDKLNYRVRHNKDAIFTNTRKFKAAIAELSALLAKSGGEGADGGQTFHRLTRSVLETYARCNYITKVSRVPFPTVEFIVYAVFVCICGVAIAFLAASVRPLHLLAQLRRLKKLQDDLPFLSDPGARLRELCVGDGNSDIMRILLFFLVLIVFILNAILVTTFKKSVLDYQLALDLVSANECV